MLLLLRGGNEGLDGGYVVLCSSIVSRYREEGVRYSSRQPLLQKCMPIDLQGKLSCTYHENQTISMALISTSLYVT